MEIKKERIREDRYSVTVPWLELKNLLIKEVNEKLGLAINDYIKYEIKIRQKEAGSPSYSVDEWTSYINVTVQLPKENGE